MYSVSLNGPSQTAEYFSCFGIFLRSDMNCHFLLTFLAAVLFYLVDETEAAKGSLRAGVMSRTNLRRKHSKVCTYT